MIRIDSNYYRLRKIIANATDCCMRDIGSYRLIPGTQKPTVDGRRRSFRYETKGGRPIYHPSAYSKCGWSNMVYVRAEFFSVTVGIDWIAANTKLATKSVRKQVNLLRAEMARSTPAAKLKQAMRAARRKSVLQPSLKERLGNYKRQLRVDALRNAGIELWEGMGYWDWEHLAQFPFAVKWVDRGVRVGFRTMPTVEEAEAALEEGWRRKMDRDAVEAEAERRRIAAEAERYAKLVAATMPVGRIHFTSEGGFYVSPN